MNIKITGKEVKATDAIKEYVEKKVERLVKYFGEDFDVVVTIKSEKALQISEIHVNAKSNTYRAVTEHKDLYASIDKNIDILEGQVRKAKTIKERINKEQTLKTLDCQEETEKNELENEVIKTTYYDIKPMMVEDAKCILEDKTTSSFLAFINVESGKVNVIYRLKDGKNFGIAEPEA